MAEISRFFADVGGDRLNTAAQLNRIFDQLLQEKDGVIRGLGNALAVTNSGALAVDINTGSAVMAGRIYENTASVNKALDAVTSGSKRYDRIVVRVDETARTMLLTVIKGTEGESPSVPSIDGTTDVLLAKILIDRSSGSYVYTLTDERVYCDGLVSKTVIAKLNGGTYSEDDIADGTSYKRIQAAKADALNSSTIVAGTIWSSGNDGNGGTAPLAKGIISSTSCPDNTATTIATLAANEASGRPDVYFVAVGTSAHTIAADTTLGFVINYNGTGVYVPIKTATNTSVSVSDSNVQVTQTEGVTEYRYWRISKFN